MLPPSIRKVECCVSCKKCIIVCEIDDIKRYYCNHLDDSPGFPKAPYEHTVVNGKGEITKIWKNYYDKYDKWRLWVMTHETNCNNICDEWEKK